MFRGNSVCDCLGSKRLSFFQAHFTLLKMLLFCTKYCLDMWGEVVEVWIFLIYIISKEVDDLSSQDPVLASIYLSVVLIISRQNFKTGGLCSTLSLGFSFWLTRDPIPTSIPCKAGSCEAKGYFWRGGTSIEKRGWSILNTELGWGKTPLHHPMSAKTRPMLRTLDEHSLLRKQEVIVLTKNLCLRT